MRALQRLGAPAAAGALGALAFPPFDLWPLAVVAPVPLLLAWRGSGPRRAPADGFVAGAVFFGVVVSWTWFFGVVAYFPFVAVLAASWAGTGAVVAQAQARGAGGPLVIASVWTVFEALRGRWPLGGFSWGELGYAFHDVPVARSVAGWGGLLFVSFLSVTLAALLAQGWSARRAGEGWPRAPIAGVVAVLALALAAHAALPDLDETESLRIAIVQGNDRNRRLTATEAADRFLPRSHFELAASLERTVDLVVFPESSLDEDPRIDPFLRDGVGRVATRLDAWVLANAPVEIESGRRLHNTNFLYGPAGRLEDTYVKRHLVPYGEYVPGRRFLEGLIDELEQVPRDHASGPRFRIFDLGGVRIANLICFESAFTGISRDYADDGADVLVVSTNNRSFRRSANSAQHIAIGQMRAAETGRPLVHAAISGKSAFIDAGGDVVATAPLFERTTLTRTVTGTTGRTPYVALGDWVLLGAGLILVLSGLRAALRMRQTGRFARSTSRS